jgi:predicted DNA-binding ribbon-helix-helix protein
MTPEAKARLKALAQIEGEAAYIVLENAFWHRWESLSEKKRDRAELIAATIEESMSEEADRG